MFSRDHSGQTAVIFGAMFMAVSGVAALAVDYGRLVAVRTHLQAAADAAALAGARVLQDQQLGLDTGTNTPQKAAKAYGNDYKLPHGATKADYNVTVDRGAVKVKGTVQVPLTLAKLLVNRDSSSISATAVVSTGSPRFSETHFIVDVSDSMNVAATPAEIDRLMAITKPYIDATGDPVLMAQRGCAFGCHRVHQPPFEPPGETMYSIAKKNKVLLRSDAVHSAVADLSKALLKGNTKTASIGVFHFSETWKQVLAPSTDLDDVIKASTSQVIESTTTNLDQFLPDIARVIGSSGKGATAGSAVKSAIIITDGAIGGREPKHTLTKNACEALKSNGVTVGVIYVKPYPIPFNFASKDWVEPILGDIEKSLMSCASALPLFTKAQTPGEITEALGTLAKSLATPLALTQ